MQKSGFVYIWFDRKKKRYYVGCRWGHPDDGYICSSTWMRNAYNARPHHFKRRILESNITDRKVLLEREYYWLQQMKKEELGKRYYNFYNHHFGHWSSDEFLRQRMIEKQSKIKKGKHYSPRTEFKKGECRSPRTQFQKGTTAHNKGLSFEERYGNEKGQQLRQIKSEKMKGRSVSPKTQFLKRRISTPQGTFESIAAGARELNIPYYTILRRIRAPNQINWMYI